MAGVLHPIPVAVDRPSTDKVRLFHQEGSRARRSAGKTDSGQSLLSPGADDLRPAAFKVRRCSRCREETVSPLAEARGLVYLTIELLTIRVDP